MSSKARQPLRSAADILKSRGITRLVYFHSDHFEPWRYVPGRPADYALAVEDVRTYVAASGAHEFGRRATLFYKANVNFLVAPERRLWRADPTDAIGFVPSTPQAETQAQEILDLLAGRELQLHIHHENVTWNDRMRDEAMRAHLDAPAHRRFDEARFELLLRLNLDMLERQPGFDRGRWFFVHGHWALNGADPHECTLVREIEILRRNGCLGDFTQPSGRPHTDSRLEEPYLARPVPLAKGYDRPDAEPIAAAGAGEVPADRFLVWASRINHRFTSIDHYSSFVHDRMADPQLFARANAEQGFAHDGVLYVKTHAHTMQPIYWQEDGCGPFPHAHPGIIAELGALFDAADEAGAAVEFATASEAFDRLMAAPRPAPADLVARYALGEGDAMAGVGCDIVFRGADGGANSAPPLAPAATALPPLAQASPDAGANASIWPTIVPLAPVQREGAPPTVTAHADAELLALAETLHMVVQPPGSVPPEQEPPFAAEIAAAACIEAARLDRDMPLVVIGCGDGLLATLLAMHGRHVVGIDADEALIAQARDIAARAIARGELARPPRFEQAHFPGWRPADIGLERATAIVAGIISPDGASGQGAFVRGLSCFDRAIVDLARFFVVRGTAYEQSRLIDLFDHAGFAPPQMIAGAGEEARFAIFSPARRHKPLAWAGRLLRSFGLAGAVR